MTELSFTVPDELVEAIAERVAELLAEGADQSSPSPWLTIPEAADYLRTSERTVQRLIAKGRVRSTALGRRRLLHRAELDAYLGAGDGGGIAATTPPRRRGE